MASTENMSANIGRTDGRQEARQQQADDKLAIRPGLSSSLSPSSSGSSTADGAELAREAARTSNLNGVTDPISHVSVEQAEADFSELRKRLSRTRDPVTPLPALQETDLEKGGKQLSGAAPLSDGSEFDLEQALRTGLDAQREAGIRPKHIGVYWDHLTVKGMGGQTNYVKTFPKAIIEFFDVITPVMRWLKFDKKSPEVSILDDIRGLCRPGEMVLVLGNPGSGCTTFLKAITNHRLDYTAVTGDVRYGAWTADQFGEYRGEAMYNDEDDQHHATLTVEQTLGFALDCKCPGKLPAGMTKQQYKERITTLLLRMFSIEHTRHTVVGGFNVPGVSGGERKRVSIAEMMCSNACVCAWDNSTRGLDASTALDFTKSLRIQTDLYKLTTFVTLKQASENMYAIFDKVLVLDAGRQIYFGPATEARAYFEGLGFARRPRQTTPDYVCGCADHFERQYAPSRSPANAPHDAASLADAFRHSATYRTLLDNMAVYEKNLEHEADRHDDFRTAVREQKRRGASPRSSYSVGFHHQIWALMKRQFVLKMQDRLALMLSWFRNVAIALILGSLYLNLGQTSASAFSKGGLMFIALLYNAFQAFVELGATMAGRPIVNKHWAYAFHRPSALWIANVFVDQAFAASQILVFSIIVYFMANLYRSAGAFFTFYLMILVGNIAMTLFFRMIGCFSPDVDYAIKFAVAVVTLFIVTTGYLIQYQSQLVWLRWIFWINPLGLAFSSMMVNEFSRINMTCTAESVVPSGDSYDDPRYQICTLPGSTAGSLDVAGSAYTVQGFSYHPDDLWRNFGIIMSLIALFFILNVTLGEFIRFSMGSSQAVVRQRPDAERKALNAALARKRQERLNRKQRQHVQQEQKVAEKEKEHHAAATDAEAEETSEFQLKSESILTWEDVCYDVPVPGGTRRLLNNIYGYARPGQLTALMGASGAGKTTLLDVLASRKNVGVVRGDILVDGARPGKEFQRSTSYAEQLDVHDPTQTVREALRFSADLRQPYSTLRAEKYAYVEEVLALLEMENIADAIIGVPGNGLTVEQRKRVTIGVELAARPQLLLFLDEPTSGLDSQSAFNIVRFLRKLAAAGQAILCTIHQPNASVFENFDRLLLLKRGGRCVYFGDIGRDARVLRAYLARHGAVARETDNVAEFMLDATGSGISSSRGTYADWADLWDASPEFTRVKQEICEIREGRRVAAATVAAANKELHAEYASPAHHQLRVVLRRMNLSFWRSPNYLFTRVFVHVIIALFCGISYLDLDSSRTSLQNRIFVIFQVTVLPALVMTQVEALYHIKRAIFFREQLSKMYSSTVFAASIVAAEVPYLIICAVCFFVPLYYLPGFQPEASRAGLQFLIILITSFLSITLAQALAAITPTTFIASQFDPFIMIVFSLFCGVTIPPPQIPRFWRSWLYQIDPFRWLISAMTTTALQGVPVECTSTELNRFHAPNGQTCGEYMAPFFARGGSGYLVDNATADCEYCAYKVGDEFYAQFGLRFENRWRDTGILAAFIGSNLIILFLACRFLNFNKR